MLKGITHLTFDCYGTLIDWEQGILDAVQPWLERAGVTAEPMDILRSFVRHEARLEGMPWQLYRDVLREVIAGMAADLGVKENEVDRALLVASLPNWPPFPETVPALRALGKRFHLCILSNTDDGLFAETQKRLETTFAQVITAEQVRSYKPGKAHFVEALRRTGVPVNQILHVAQSLYHDHVPAQEMGFRTVWVNRSSLLSDSGLAPAADARWELVVKDLHELAEAVGGVGWSY